MDQMTFVMWKGSLVAVTPAGSALFSCSSVFWMLSHLTHQSHSQMLFSAEMFQYKPPYSLPG